MKLRALLYAVSLLSMGAAAYLGLVWAPPEAMMGEVYRIIYVHVPVAMMALFAFTLCFLASVAYQLTASYEADALAEATAEVGVVLATLLLVTGSIWGRPTWGVWWTWDPRLTTAAILWLAFCGYLALRRFVDAPERRATWSAVTAIIVAVDIPIVYLSVRWWNSLHQLQSSPQTVDGPMVIALRVSLVAFLLVLVTFVSTRYELARRRLERELAPPPAYPQESPLLRSAT